MKLLGQPEPAHHTELLLLAAKRTAPRGRSKYLGLPQSHHGQGSSPNEGPWHHDEVDQWDGNRHQGQRYPHAENSRSPFDAISEGECVELDMGNGRLGTESSEGAL